MSRIIWSFAPEDRHLAIRAFGRVFALNDHPQRGRHLDGSRAPWLATGINTVARYLHVGRLCFIATRKHR